MLVECIIIWSIRFVVFGCWHDFVMLINYTDTGERNWTVFRVWEACFNLTHVQHLVLLYGIIVVTKLFTIADRKRFKIVPETIRQQWKNFGVHQIIRPRRNVLADIFYNLADNFGPLADNYDHLADKNIREKIPTWLNNMFYAKVFPQLLKSGLAKTRVKKKKKNLGFIFFLWVLLFFCYIFFSFLNFLIFFFFKKWW